MLARRLVGIAVLAFAACSHKSASTDMGATTDMGVVHDLSATVDGMYDAAPILDANVDAGGTLGAVSLQNGKFCRDGVCGWIPKGMIFDGRVCPLAVCTPTLVALNKAFTSQELDEAITAFHLDTIRLNVSQYGLDSQDTTYYSATYLQSVKAAVQLARNKGMSVIVSMQSEAPACGCQTPEDKPSASTVRAWQAILGPIKDDAGVMLEIFNEPNDGKEDGSTPVSWTDWQTEEQTLVSALRTAGAKNVLLVDGIFSSHVLQGALAITDSLSQVAYVIHAFPELNNALSFLDTKDWDAAFGTFCASSGTACMVDAWFSGGNDECFPEKQPAAAQTVYSPSLTAAFLEYISGQTSGTQLFGKPIGLIGYAYDRPDYFITSTNALTSFAGFTTCDASSSVVDVQGPGKMVAEYFASGVVKIQ